MSDTTIFYTLFGANACSSTKESNNNNNINSLIFKMDLMNGKINALIQVVYLARFDYFIVWNWNYFLNKHIIDVISFSIEMIIDKIKRL